jgi:hypothetical protein
VMTPLRIESLAALDGGRYRWGKLQKLKGRGLAG